METKTDHLIKIGLLANVFEWYEFSIFGFLAGLIGQLFFDEQQPIVTLLKGLMLFSMSYIARPLGAVCFGWMADHKGNQAVLRFSLLLMSIPTILIGLLPTYHTLGSLATVLLISLRLIQGFAAGGELPSSARYIFESATESQRHLLCAITMSSPTIGMLMGSFVSYILTSFLDPLSCVHWGWRIPFLLGVPLTIIIAYCRESIQLPHITEQPIKAHPCPTKELIRPLIQGSLLIAPGTVCFYTLLIWMPTYLKYFLHVKPATAQLTNCMTLGLTLPLYLGVGYLAQRFSYRWLIVISLVSLLATIVPLLNRLTGSHTLIGLLVPQLLLVSLYIILNAVTIQTLMALFPYSMRSFGVNLAWSLPGAFLGSTTPLVCTYAIHKTGSLLFPAYYIMFFGLLALPVALRQLPRYSFW